MVYAVVMYLAAGLVFAGIVLWVSWRREPTLFEMDDEHTVIYPMFVFLMMLAWPFMLLSLLEGEL